MQAEELVKEKGVKKSFKRKSREKKSSVIAFFFSPKKPRM